jgi:hypothetical protein
MANLMDICPIVAAGPYSAWGNDAGATRADAHFSQVEGEVEHWLHEALSDRGVNFLDFDPDARRALVEFITYAMFFQHDYDKAAAQEMAAAPGPGEDEVGFAL